MQSRPLLWFILKVFFWLPVCYWIWFNASDFTTWVAADLIEQIFISNLPDQISGIEQQGYLLDVITKISPPAQDLTANKTGEIIFSVNTLNYNFGLPLCVALILSSPGNIILIFRNILFSIVILLLIQLWGISFNIMKTLFLEIPSQLNYQINLSQWHGDAIALGYQLGSLILPAVTPLVIWLALYRKFIITIAPALSRFDS